MTISNTDRKAGPYDGNGSASMFAFAFKVFQDSDLLVVLATLSTGAETTLTLGTDYSVTRNIDQDNNPGGTVTLTAGALATGFSLTLASQVPQTQPTQFTNSGGFYPALLNTVADRLTILVQQLAEQVGRSLKVPISSAASATADALMGLINSAVSTCTAAAASAAESAHNLFTYTPTSVVNFGAVGDGIADDTAPIRAAILSCVTTGKKLFLPAGAYRITAPLEFLAPIMVYGEGVTKSVILSDHAGVAVDFSTNNRPDLSDIGITRATIGARGSRTGTGLRVFGDVGAGSSIQMTASRVRITGFAISMDLAGCFLSSFSHIQSKQADISYYFRNNTNNSITFFACSSNSSIGQHVYADGGTAECGATFIAPEFEDGFKFPAFHVAGGTAFYFQIIDPYLYENNVGTDAGSAFQFFQFDIAGQLRVRGKGVSCAGLIDARLLYGRRNASVGKWDITFDDVAITSARGTGPDIDVDTLGAGEKVYVSPSCRYTNANAACYLTAHNNGSPGSLLRESGGIGRVLGAAFNPASTNQKSTDPNVLDEYEEGTFTPSWSNLTLGNGTTTGSYVKTGQSVSVSVTLTWGSTTSTSGEFQVTNLPFACEAAQTWQGAGNILDFGTANYPIRTRVAKGASTLQANCYLVSGSYIISQTLSATQPITWTTGDELTMTCVYRAVS